MHITVALIYVHMLYTYRPCGDPSLLGPALNLETGKHEASFNIGWFVSLSKFVFPGLGNPRNGLHPVQARLAKAHGSQCGFCTPGFVMSMYSLLRSKAEAPTETEIEDNLAGNLWYGHTYTYYVHGCDLTLGMLCPTYHSHCCSCPSAWCLV